MPSFNLTENGLRCIVGHVGRDPELKHTQCGKQVADCSVATNFKRKDGTVDTTWHSVKAWEEQADCLMKVHKGQVICVVGKESTREWEGKSYTDLTAWFVGAWIRPETKLPVEGSRPMAPGEDSIPF